MRITVPMDKLDSFVVNHLKSLILQPEHWKDILHKVIDRKQVPLVERRLKIGDSVKDESPPTSQTMTSSQINQITQAQLQKFADIAHERLRHGSQGFKCKHLHLLAQKI